MAIALTPDSGFVHHSPTKKSIFVRLMDRMVEARQRYADRQVKVHLANFDDATLIDLGYDPKEIRPYGSGLFSG